ncbi:MAG TPA: hypothetical protein VFP90_14480 [Gemmatimonadaceae bacterium]|nr:hypothetical protein [Gemmatimonadaceae bacterium]
MKFSRPALLPVALVATFALAACSDAPSAAGVSPTDALAVRNGAAPHEMLADGDYEANLHVLNAGAQSGLDPDPADGARGVARGKAYFTIRNGEITATVSALGIEGGMIHPQHIHTAASCPPASADVNQDGFVDVIEGVPFYGPILIPLDNDLASQASGTFPMATGLEGRLSYQSSASFAALLADLNAPDPNTADAVVKLDGAPLALETRHVVIHGVDANTPLPSTVASLPGVPAFLTLPIACGDIRRIR